MVTEKQIELKLQKWLTRHFKSSSFLFKQDTQAKIDEFKMRADLIAIQSKSNVIHVFEVKNKVTDINLLSAIWQTFSFYGNYRWLVLPSTYIRKIEETSSTKMQLKKLGIGVITFDSNGQFKINKEADYIDGNFLKYWPDVETEWDTNIKKKS